MQRDRPVLLQRDNDPYLAISNLGLTSRKAREEQGNRLDKAKQTGIEDAVSAYIHTPSLSWFCLRAIQKLPAGWTKDASGRYLHVLVVLHESLGSANMPILVLPKVAFGRLCICIEL